MMKQAILRSAFVGVALLGSMGGANAQVPAPKDLVAPGKVTYALVGTFAPFQYIQDGKLVGLDIDLIDAMAKKMGLTPAPMTMEFKGLIPALQSKRVDIINAAMYIRPEREEQVDFIPYVSVGNELVVQTRNPKAIAGRENICGANVAVTLGGFQEKLAREDDENCKKTGKAGVNVMTFPTAQDAALALKHGRADAIYNSTPGAYKQVHELPNDYKIAGKTFGPFATVGFAVRKGDTAMKDALTKSLAAIKADGSFDAILKKNGMPESSKLN